MHLRGLVLYFLLFVSVASLHGQTGAALSTAAQGPRLAGRVLDSTGAVMASAAVRVSQGTNVVREARTDANGEFAINVPAGEYKLEVSAPDFRAYEQTIRVVPNMAPLSISLTLAELTTEVQVTTQRTEVSVDPEASLATTNLTAEQIKDLPEDEEQLLAYLQQLAQANGAQGNANLIIDGIGGGRVPSRDQIQQIIINTNSFSATNSGGASIEIITRPGTQKWTGLLNLGIQDSALDARNPLDSNKANRQQRAMRTSVSGTLIPGRLTTSIGVQTTRVESEGSSIRAITPTGSISRSVVSPNINHSFNMGGQLYMTKVHTLNFNGTYSWQKSENQGVGGFNLPERASNGRRSNYQIQFNERAIFSPTFIHEMRFRIARNTSRQVPLTEAVAINVLDAFNSGGAQNRSETRGTTYNWGNNLRYQFNPRVTSQSGLDFSYTKNRNIAESNYLGSFTFASLEDYLNGKPLNFRQTTGNPLVEISQLDFSAFFQLDWRVNTKLAVGMGWRYQGQTHLRDYNNVAPTMNVSYQLRQGTVLRVGTRKTYSTFGIFNTEQLLRQDGTTRQFETVILNPSYPDPFAEGAATTSGVGNTTLRTKDKDLEAPYSHAAQIGLDHSLGKNWRMNLSMDVTRGIHQLRTRNINAPYPGTPLAPELLTRLNSFDPAIRSAARDEVDRMRPSYPNIGNVYQFESTGNYLSRTFGITLIPPTNLSFFNNKFGISGTLRYSLNMREDDSSAVNQYDWSEWARTGSRHNVNMALSLRLPKGFTANLPISYTSGSFYSITSGRDENGDQATNDRPAGYARNSEVGPSRYNVNMNVSKTIYLRRAVAVPRPVGATPPAGTAPPAGAVPQLVLPAGAPPELAARLAELQAQVAVQAAQQQVNAPPPTGPRVQFGISVQNLLNNPQFFSYSGVLTSPLFGQPVGSSPGRRISMNMTFSWQ